MKNGSPTVPAPTLHSPGIALRDLFIYPKMKSHLMRTRYVGVQRDKERASFRGLPKVLRWNHSLELEEVHCV